MKIFTYTYLLLLAMSCSMPQLSASQVGSASAASSSSSSSAPAQQAETVTQNTSPLTGRQCYELGLLCQGKNEQAAALCYIQGVKLGEPMAYLQLGICYTLGRGVAQDITRGTKLYEKGALLIKQSCIQTEGKANTTNARQVKLPCGDDVDQNVLERVLQGRGEGQLPLCPACKQPFKMDQLPQLLRKNLLSPHSS